MVRAKIELPTLKWLGLYTYNIRLKFGEKKVFVLNIARVVIFV